jgi:hypothetical protein
MKKIILLLLAPLFLLSCVDKPKEDVKYKLKNITSFELKKLPIKEGYTTIAKLNGDVIAQSSDSIPYFYPKFAKQGDVTFEYVPNDAKTAPAPLSTMSMLLCFEDLTDGDDDYNDFICKMDITYYFQNNNKIDRIEIKVLPIAHGGSLQLGFAVNCPKNQTINFSDNISEDLFSNAIGSNTNINEQIYTNLSTYSQEIIYQHVPGNLNITDPEAYEIDPYITVNGRQVHIVLTNALSSVNYNEYVNDQGRPYGIAIPPKTNYNGVIKYFRYPMEKINIRTAYPNTFQNWLDGNATYFDYSNPVESNVQTINNMITLLGTLISK